MLLLARIFQGLSLGGEYGASATYMSEMAARGRPRLLVELPLRHADRRSTVALSVLIVLQHLLSGAEMAAWGWRIPFVTGAAARGGRVLAAPYHAGIRNPSRTSRHPLPSAAASGCCCANSRAKP